jgi:hypothetical protein
MRSITAVEIGADICALASTSVRGGDVHLFAAETLDPGAFPGVDSFTLAVRQSRRALKLPRRCRAVVWGLPDGARRRDPIVLPLIEPLTKAGFRVDRVVTPCNALGALARLRVSRTGGAMCWLGINRNGVAIIVVRPGKLLYSHSFGWDSNVGASGSQARLLQRYSLVAFLAPEVRRAFAAARQKGTTVDGIITCGNLPDLRSLTMPLIEELDIEVETLDSLEGLVVKPDAADKLSETAQSIRLACAGAIARETRSVDEEKRRRVRRIMRLAPIVRVAALVLLLCGAAYWYYFGFRLPASPAKSPAPVARTADGRGPTSDVRRPTPDVRPATPSAATPQATPNPVPSIPPPKSNPVATNPPVVPSSVLRPPTSASVGEPPSAVAPKSNPVATNPPVVPSSVLRPPTSAPPSVLRPPSSVPTSVPSPPTPDLRPPSSGTGTLSSPPPAADKPDAARTKQAVRPMPELLKDPVPRVTAILMSAERRLATVGDEGRIIGVGDTIGRRVVVGMDDRTVLFQEPSGVQIRVALGGKVVGVERVDR